MFYLFFDSMSLCTVYIVLEIFALFWFLLFFFLNFLNFFCFCFADNTVSLSFKNKLFFLFYFPKQDKTVNGKILNSLQGVQKEECHFHICLPVEKKTDFNYLRYKQHYISSAELNCVWISIKKMNFWRFWFLQFCELKKMENRNKVSDFFLKEIYWEIFYHRLCWKLPQWLYVSINCHYNFLGLFMQPGFIARANECATSYLIY